MVVTASWMNILFRATGVVSRSTRLVKVLARCSVWSLQNTSDAEAVASGMGSWLFIIIQSVIVVVWIISNVWLLTHPFDPYPLILLNLLFSTQAAYAAPVIMMSQNRQAAKDRLMAESDYHCNIKGEEEIRHIME